MEAAAARDPTTELAEALESLAGVEEVAVAVDSVRAAALWRYREAHTEAINSLGAPHKLDVTLPLGSLAAFIERVRAPSPPSPRRPVAGSSATPPTATST